MAAAWLSVVVKRGATTLVREDNELSISLLLSSIYAQMLAKWIFFFFAHRSLVKTEKSVNHFIQLVWPNN